MNAILRFTGGGSVKPYPRGIGAVLSKQTIGFWGRLGDSPARPDFSQHEIPSSIYTFEPWPGCLWGPNCRFCYVPNNSIRLTPGGKDSYWYQKWGHWLLPKADIAARLRHELIDGSGATRGRYRGAFIYMSAKTDPFLPLANCLEITRQNLKTFLDADVFLMCQTRSAKVVEDAEVFDLIGAMARRKKVGVSFSISTDLLEEQRRIERGSLAPEERFEIMGKLKETGVFVSAAVAPLMPYGPTFAQRLLDCSHHASVQLLKVSGSGASTPEAVLREVETAVPDYRNLDRALASVMDEVDPSGRFSWGTDNKGFIGAFLAARRFYKSAGGKSGQSRGG